MRDEVFFLNNENEIFPMESDLYSYGYLKLIVN